MIQSPGQNRIYDFPPSFASAQAEMFVPFQATTSSKVFIKFYFCIYKYKINLYLFFCLDQAKGTAVVSHNGSPVAMKKDHKQKKKHIYVEMVILRLTVTETRDGEQSL